MGDLMQLAESWRRSGREADADAVEAAVDGAVEDLRARQGARVYRSLAGDDPAPAENILEVGRVQGLAEAIAVLEGEIETRPAGLGEEYVALAAALADVRAGNAGRDEPDDVMFG